MPVNSRSLLLLYLLLVGVVAALRAQEPIAGSFIDIIDVRVVNIETVVTNPEGQRVGGLRPEDFRLLIDGEEVSIDYFTEIRDGRIFSSAPDPGHDPSRTESASGADEATVATNYLVFIDDVFSVAAQRNRVLQSLGKQIQGLNAADQMAIVAFDGRRLELLSPWTRSEETLSEALSEARGRPAGGAFRRMERRTLAPGLTGGIALSEQHLDQTVGAAISALRTKSPDGGRKLLLLLAGGWPWEIVSESNDDLFNQGSADSINADRLLDISSQLRAMEYLGRATPLYQRLTDTANLLGFTIYPVDVSGLGASGSAVDREEIGDPVSSLVSLRDPDGGQNDATLMALAQETGGQALISSLRLESLTAAVADTRSYYWLGFQVNRRTDGRRHQIEVRLARPELEVRSRRTYADLSLTEEARMRVEGDLLWAGTAGSAFALTVEAPHPLPERLMKVPIRVEIPTDQVTYLPSQESFEVRLLVSIGTMDGNDAISDVRSMPVTLDAMSENAQETLSFGFEVTLRRETQRLAVAIRDLPTGNLMSSTTEVRP